MAHLLSASDISAVYITKTKQLILGAKVPGYILGPEFERVKGFVGGLRFSLVGFSGGLRVRPEPQTVTDKIFISLPVLHFNNKSVLIDTAEGTKTIEIKYTGLNGESLGSGINFVSEKEASGPIAGGVLTPINYFLPGDRDLAISAVIPKVEGGSKASVDVSFNQEFLKLVTASVHDETITWIFKWAKLPTEEGQNPQLVNVNTTIWNGIVGPLAKTSRNIQGYIVHFVLLQE